MTTTSHLPPGANLRQVNGPAQCKTCGDPVDIMCSELCLNCLEAAVDEEDGDLDQTFCSSPQHKQ